MASQHDMPLPDAIGTPTGPKLVLPEDVVRQLTACMLRAVQYLAEGRSVEWIAGVEFRSMDGIRSRVRKVNRVLGTKSAFQSYRLLLLAGLIELR